jgi:hypothetical protein
MSIDKCRIMEFCPFLFFNRKSEAIHSFDIRHSSFVIPLALPLVGIQEVAKAVTHQVKAHDDD